MSTYAFVYIVLRADDDDRDGALARTWAPRPESAPDVTETLWLDWYPAGSAVSRGASVVGHVDLVRRTWTGTPPWPFTAEDVAEVAGTALRDCEGSIVDGGVRDAAVTVPR